MLMEGFVVDTNDPQQMGRVKVWVPSIDGDKYQIKNLPWATFVSPLAGQLRNYPSGPNASVSKGLASYGWWAIPKEGSLVIVGLLYNDQNRRVYMGSFFRDHGNRSLPAGRMRPDIGDVPLTDTFDPLEPASTNLKDQFNGKLSASEAKTRGAVERPVAQDKTEKDGTNGYHGDLLNPKDYDSKPAFDPQTVSLTTPGHHTIVFQDNPENGRVRIKTAAGHQIILDDANERIYVSTAKGKNWIEFDQDGRVHLYAEQDISIATAASMNITVGKDFKLNAGGSVNIQAGSSMNLASCKDMNVAGTGVNLQSTADFNILASSNLLQTASNIHLNGPSAKSAVCPVVPSVVPQHEPWVREASKSARNKNWKA
jgi:hypothetical protein